MKQSLTEINELQNGGYQNKPSKSLPRSKPRSKPVNKPSPELDFETDEPDCSSPSQQLWQRIKKAARTECKGLTDRPKTTERRHGTSVAQMSFEDRMGQFPGQLLRTGLTVCSVRAAFLREKRSTGDILRDMLPEARCPQQHVTVCLRLLMVIW